MKFDILSDLHFDYYFKTFPSQKDIRKVYDTIFVDRGDVLIIAGDLGHDNQQNILVLKMIQRYYYKSIICVLGNHDYYLVNKKAENDYYMDSYKRAVEMKDLINNNYDIYCLDGDIVEIDGISFGGAMGWYSNAYLKEYYPLESYHSDAINKLWKNNVNDYEYIKGVDYYDTLYKHNLSKIESIYDKCDVMITHINPSFKNEHISPQYKGEVSNTFFCFDGHRFMDDGNMKYWVFGHTHDAISYEYNGVKCICNPLGYPNEKNIQMKSIVVV